MIVGKKREPKLPEIPTATEAGLKGFDRSMNWLGLHAPAKTPAPVIQRIYGVIAEAMKSNAYLDQIRARGFEPVGDTPDHFTARIQSDYDFFGEVARTAKVQVE
jgi:tripartite-type tricarboxylate transporter receptor subunit TctC